MHDLIDAYLKIRDNIFLKIDALPFTNLLTARYRNCMDVAESKFENRDGNVPEFRSAYTDEQLQLLRRCRVFVESVTICVIIGSVWALLSLPTVFYFFNPDSQQVSAGQVSCGYGKVRGSDTVKIMYCHIVAHECRQPY